ncbi:hypothetical protein [Ruania halotolerans]|uniref:hypothetical protein n=1 Tax=Ruania halotolerans TaxID=2897773 RepID=UPI001E5ADE34|nr:hypothetical protein [Ruania halotolerans]UFU06510.1 hypothetical protein LQF10_19170 [Ruania halotolerans]
MTAPRTLRTRLAAAGGGLALVAGAIAAGGAQPTTAAWTDSEYARATVLASTLNPPRANGCSVAALAGSATLRWLTPATPPSSYSYEWQLVRNATGATVRSGTHLSTVVEHVVNATGLVSLFESYTFRIRTVSGSWQSVWRTATVTTTVGALGITLIGSCSWN